jgi:hypothetical protein
LTIIAIKATYRALKYLLKWKNAYKP